MAAPGTPGHLVACTLNTRRLVGARVSSGWQSIREYRGQPTSKCGWHKRMRMAYFTVLEWTLRVHPRRVFEQGFGMGNILPAVEYSGSAP